MKVTGYVTCSFRAKKQMSLGLLLAHPLRALAQPINLIQGDANHQTGFTLKGTTARHKSVSSMLHSSEICLIGCPLYYLAYLVSFSGENTLPIYKHFSPDNLKSSLIDVEEKKL